MRPPEAEKEGQSERDQEKARKLGPKNACHTLDWMEMRPDTHTQHNTTQINTNTHINFEC